ncbi:C-C motif chemokine 19-like [Acipenser oxyrinchus oxyrinchus]|uniref:C-C motif chemokine 19-like n=1 Tax=Acipenser oxyrinchus oxyrinchus TaxID=40147 RepID=A0AAD8GLE0_ACIOX|nr:C-C motif chemokine 19-like [Acipenser oxyrinchus oxyrinchus]
MALKAAAVLLIAATLWCYSEGNNDGAIDCCLSTSNAPIPYKILKSYRDQSVEEGCTIRATVFITSNQMALCAPPKAKWVKKLKSKLDRKSKKKSKKPSKKPSKKGSRKSQ